MALIRDGTNINELLSSFHTNYTKLSPGIEPRMVADIVGRPMVTNTLLHISGRFHMSLAVK